ncbi:hypothetical protein ZYGR_0N01680 [Zygosaccharomyces rouxii]|uniref:ZYRO0D04224p n=2 Tax=Zygosaccharomyces rouxii TaxID=4956 RepID=C5DV64_ZYGRC|nr:uncharacterized protein ZYRO0D04224g [Zygosaccharomyces rouxii]KAH9200597.1 hypothetical protein LQ764DRAFT_233877 [Zygosaccharomyces rouxii]GAV48763.1 hypothetical protein ZYGR_0N01680 [Zygosaccharomyces rouxii]CAR27683.1 ZYRO0D04224p [Zygosaccharomyces rouxii]
MAKRKKPSVFNDDNGAGDDEDGFMNYVREKADQSRKRAKDSSGDVKIAEQEILNQELSHDAVSGELESSGSKYMDQLLESRKRRELDRLHAQSIKMRLERKLEGAEDSEEIITDGYRQKKEKYERADELAQDEQNREVIDSNNSILGADGVALKMIATKKPQENYQPPLELIENPSKPAETHYSNDVYVNESIKSSSTWEKQDDLNPVKKLECVKKFLRSEKNKQDIDILVKQYSERHNSIKKFDN